jgi:DNA-binding NtrC family response regulator
MENVAKIFLVDDDLFSLNVYRQNLENLGYNDISLFLNGTICLNNLHQKPTIVFLDHNMDDLNGFEVLKKIKRYDPNIYVVIISAQESMKIAIDALKYGAFDYIIKGDNESDKMKNVLLRIESIHNEIPKAHKSFIKKLLSIF